MNSSHLSRRTWMQGGAAMLGAGVLTGHRLAAAAAASSTPRNLILVMANGGWDTTYVFDPKPGSTTLDTPAGELREFGGIPILIDPERPTVTSFFEDYGDLVAVVNGVHTQSISHSD